jgi:tRNA modification GTPase
MHHDEREVYDKITKQHHHKIIIIYNKSDLEQKNEFLHKGFSVSSHNKSDNKIIEEAIENKIATLLDTISSPFLLNSRHYNLLITLEKQCHEILPLLTHNIAYELLSIHLQEAAVHVSELTGKTISENAMDEVFRSFCVGK